jgi:hypothetical protein
MRHTVNLNSDQESALKAYRDVRRGQRDGRILQKTTAISELLARALSGIAPAETITMRELVARIEAVEAGLEPYCGEDLPVAY